MAKKSSKPVMHRDTLGKKERARHDNLREAIKEKTKDMTVTQLTELCHRLNIPLVLAEPDHGLQIDPATTQAAREGAADIDPAMST